MADLVSLLRNVDEESMYAAPFTTKTLIDAAANRIEELEKALSHIYAWYPISVTQPHQTINDMREFARAALAGEKKDE